jgi:hypothetical protein
VMPGSRLVVLESFRFAACFITFSRVSLLPHSSLPDGLRREFRRGDIDENVGIQDPSAALHLLRKGALPPEGCIDCGQEGGHPCCFKRGSDANEVTSDRLIRAVAQHRGERMAAGGEQIRPGEWLGARICFQSADVLQRTFRIAH